MLLSREQTYDVDKEFLVSTKLIKIECYTYCKVEFLVGVKLGVSTQKKFHYMLKRSGECYQSAQCSCYRLIDTNSRGNGVLLSLKWYKDYDSRNRNF